MGIADGIFPRPMGAMEMYWQGSSLVESIDCPFAANEGPRVATARLSTQSLLSTHVTVLLLFAKYDMSG